MVTIKMALIATGLVAALATFPAFASEKSASAELEALKQQEKTLRAEVKALQAAQKDIKVLAQVNKKKEAIAKLQAKKAKLQASAS